MMSTQKAIKSLSLPSLFVCVLIAMVLTSFAQAETFIYRTERLLLDVSDIQSVGQTRTTANVAIPAEHSSWLLPGKSGVRTSIKGGMAHFQFSSWDQGDISDLLPGHTRIIFSFGLEEHNPDKQPGQSDPQQSDRWQDQYQPKLYFTIGHRW